jgi:hypothetical protein
MLTKNIIQNIATCPAPILCDQHQQHDDEEADVAQGEEGVLPTAGVWSEGDQEYGVEDVSDQYNDHLSLRLGVEQSDHGDYDKRFDLFQQDGEHLESKLSICCGQLAPAEHEKLEELDCFFVAVEPERDDLPDDKCLPQDQHQTEEKA